MPDTKTYKQHFENKHPKNPLPEELKDAEWDVVSLYLFFDRYET